MQLPSLLILTLAFLQYKIILCHKTITCFNLTHRDDGAFCGKFCEGGFADPAAKRGEPLGRHKPPHKICHRTPIVPVCKIINTLFAGLGRSILGKIVPSVLGTALGLRSRAVLKTSGTVFPNTDLRCSGAHGLIPVGDSDFFLCPTLVSR